MTRFEHMFRTKKVAFLDLDGTIYMGNALIPGAKEFLEYLKESGIIFYFLSNNSSRSKADYVAKLSNLGITTDEEGIILSTDGVIAFLQQKQIKDVYVVGTKSMKDMFLRAGLETDSQSPSYIVLGFDTELTYEKLKTAALLMQDGVELIATHPDLVCPTPEGFIPDTGAMLALFEKATDQKPYKIFGKPNPEMIAHILKKHYVSPQQVVMIGDRLYTDMRMGVEAGVTTCCVLSGETTLDMIKESEYKPNFVIKGIWEFYKAIK